MFSGGESQRIRLATQIGSQLVNVLYILDEPSIGLHQRDNLRLINSLKELRDMGNSVIVVEHDKDMMLAADYVDTPVTQISLPNGNSTSTFFRLLPFAPLNQIDFPFPFRRLAIKI